jgi:hypothetical protein
MLSQAADRISAQLADDATVLQVGATRGALPRADWVLDDAPHEPHGEARFSRRTWVVRDVCGREPWPFGDGRFDFAVCTALPFLRDPVGVCAELARVARAGYVELPTIEAELGGGSDARWLCDVVEAGLVFIAKPAAAHTDPRIRVGRRHLETLEDIDRVHALFWERRLPARERIVDPAELVDELADRVRRRVEPSGAELVLSEARRVGGMAGAAALRSLDGLLRGR